MLRPRVAVSTASQPAAFRNVFHSSWTTSAMALAAARSQLALRRCRSARTRRVWRRLPRCTFAASMPMDCSNVASSRFLGSSMISIGFASGEAADQPSRDTPPATAQPSERTSRAGMRTDRRASARASSEDEPPPRSCTGASSVRRILSLAICSWPAISRLPVWTHPRAASLRSTSHRSIDGSPSVWRQTVDHRVSARGVAAWCGIS